MSLPWWGGGWGGGSSCGGREITHLGGSHAWCLERQGQTQGQTGCKEVLPFGITQQRRSASLVVQASSTSIPIAELLPPSRPLRMSPHVQPHSSAWVYSPNPTFQHPGLVCIRGHRIRLGGLGWGQYPVCRSHSVLHAGCRLLFPQRTRSPSVPTELPPVRGFPGCGDLSSLQIPPGFCGSHSASFPLPFLP